MEQNNNPKKRTIKNNKYQKMRHMELKFGITNHTSNHSKKTLKRNQLGGFFITDFINYIYHSLDMRQFNKFVKTFNQTKDALKKEYESFNAESEIYKDAAEQKLQYLNNWLIACKVNIIIKNLLNEQELDVNPIQKRGMEAKLKTTEKMKKDLDKRIRRLNKDQNKNKGEFRRMNKLFISNINKFEKMLDQFAKSAEFRQKIKTLKKKFDVLSRKNKTQLSKKHKGVLKEFNKRKSDYEKVASFTDSYIERTNKFVNDYSKLRREAEFFEKQFYSNKLSTVSKDNALKKWEEQIEKFYNDLEGSIEEGGKYLKELKEVKTKIRNVGARLQSIDAKDKLKIVKNIVDLLEKCIEHQTDINDLLLKLKINFSNNQPAIRLSYDSQLIFSKIIFIKKCLSSIDKLMKSL